jgi:hypothetical protein
MRYDLNYAPAYDTSDTSAINGRVDLLSPAPALQIPQFQRMNIDNTSFRAEATLGQIAPNTLNSLFFSPENIEALQQGIRYRIYVETDGKSVIGRQSDTELKIVMRSIYYQHAKHSNQDLVTQVRELNAKVLDWVVPEVLSNVKQYEMYKRDASSIPMPLERAQLSTTKGTKVLEIKSFM